MAIRTRLFYEARLTVLGEGGSPVNVARRRHPSMAQPLEADDPTALATDHCTARFEAADATEAASHLARLLVDVYGAHLTHHSIDTALHTATITCTVAVAGVDALCMATCDAAVELLDTDPALWAHIRDEMAHAVAAAIVPRMTTTPA